MNRASRQEQKLPNADCHANKNAQNKSWLLGHATILRTIAIIVMLCSVFVIGHTVHIDQIVSKLQSLGESMGFAGTLIFGGTYVVTALLFIPGSALTLASGAVFGIWIGAALVSIASTLAASLAFLIARYAARSRIEAAAQSRPFFAAVDRAIAEGGWKVVLLLRLSPVVPFSLGNYLFGLTGLRFWPYVLASWIGMMPGTLAYVYLGNLGAKGLAASAGESNMSPLEWILLIVGLVATIAVATLLTRLARRELKKYVSEPSTPANDPKIATKPMTPTPWIIAASLLLFLAIAARFFEPQIHNLLQPSQPAAQTETATIPSKPPAAFQHASLVTHFISSDSIQCSSSASHNTMSSLSDAPKERLLTPPHDKMESKDA